MTRLRGRPKGGYLPDAERKPALQRIKERHRLLAKYVAAGLTRNEIAARLDMTPERVGQLTLDPAMQNLIAQFRDHPHVVEMTGMDEIALLRSVSIQNALRSALAMQDTLNYYEDADEKVPVRESAKIFELSADRIGFGKHSTNINVNVDFAAQLDRAIDRSRSVRQSGSKKADNHPMITIAPSGDGEGQNKVGHDTLALSVPPLRSAPAPRSEVRVMPTIPLTRRF